MKTIIIHIQGAEPIRAEVEELPSPSAYHIAAMNPRDRADRDVPWLEDGVTTVLFPWTMINFIQVMPDPDEGTDFIGTFRD